jgi:hypothetical protein
MLSGYVLSTISLSIWHCRFSYFPGASRIFFVIIWSIVGNFFFFFFFPSKLFTCIGNSIQEWQGVNFEWLFWKLQNDITGFVGEHILNSHYSRVHSPWCFCYWRFLKQGLSSRSSCCTLEPLMQVDCLQFAFLILCFLFLLLLMFTNWLLSLLDN